MSVTIHLDRPHSHFTNLDILSGRVVLHLTSEAAVSGIQVKLEGESRTRLVGPRHAYADRSDKKRAELEVHKILYKVASVFPTPEIQGQSGSYTFAPGTYEYPFQFKFPFNNACSSHNSILTNLNITGLKVEVARDTNQHVKKTLPPSLTGFPDEAEIKYYVKATVIRPQFYKGNIRALAGLNFLPIEPPKTGNPNEETYARRQYQFSQSKQLGMSKKSSLFSKTLKTIPQPPVGIPPRVSVDARLPNPSILTCNEPVPLRILVKKLQESPELIFLQMLQIELIAYTQVRAHDLMQTETSNWVILSRSNMAVPLGRASDAVGTEWAVNPGLWNRIPLPSSVAPSFETCNISRAYELEIRVGLSYGSIGNIKTQLIVLPLRMQVKVYSGITPPQALLDAMAAKSRRPSKATTKPAEDRLSEPPPPPMPPRPNGPAQHSQPNEIYDDAPPSYEDAMAESLGPVDGPRREYNPTVSKSPTGSRLPGSSVAAHSSTESLDLLPDTPEQRLSGTPPPTASSRPVPERSSIDTSAQSAENSDGHQSAFDNPPQYQPVSDQQTLLHPSEQSVERRPSRMNLGVPNRKPLGGNSP